MESIAFSMDFWTVLFAILATATAYIGVSRASDEPAHDEKEEREQNDKDYYKSRRNDVRKV